LYFTVVTHRKPVEELLERLFISLDTVTAAKYLKQLCFGESVDFKPTLSSLQFSTGDCGGVKVVIVADSGLVTELFIVCNI